MHFPYLRCKQFELLALRELAGTIGQGNHISPVLEPVKKSIASLERGLESLIAHGINFTIIVNPANGDFVTNRAGLIEMIRRKLEQYENFQFGVILNQFTNLDLITGELEAIGFNRPITLIHANRLNDIEA